MKRLLAIALALCLALSAGAIHAIDLSITAANVVAGDQATYTDGIAGATITAGQVVYRDTSDGGKFKLADCDATAPAAVVAGIALHGAASGQPLKIQTSGSINLGATLVVGKIYVLSGTAGGIAPVDDLESGDRVTVLGVATSASLFALRTINSGAVVPGM